MGNLTPVLVKTELRRPVLSVTPAARLLGHFFPELLHQSYPGMRALRVFGMIQARAVARFALDVGEVRSAYDIDKTMRDVEAGDMTLEAFAAELLRRLFERFDGLCMRALRPRFVGLFVALLAR